ncbi:MAG TPA: hypothetical protein VGD56_09005, partial [Gemmatirosa sp.]
MRSLGDRARAAAEHAFRAVAIAALALAAWQRLHPAPVRPPSAERADARALPVALARWTAAPVPAVHAAFDSLPDAPTRAWLAALDAAGTRVTWQATHAPALAASAEPIADPAGGLRVDVALAATAAADTLRETRLDIADTLGPLDSARATAGGATFRLGGAATALTVRAAGATARVPAPRPPARFGAAIILARAGWEGKFTAAALEERGWTVRTRFAVDPDVVVGAPAPPRLDTNAVAVVVVLDSSAAAFAPALARYVRTGGGLVLAGEAALVPALAALAPATPALTPIDDTASSLRPLDQPRADAVPLAWRMVAGTRTLVAAARRVGAGRVVQIADEATWHRRLRPDPAAPAAHRAWWAQVLAAAAYTGGPRPDT